MKDNAFNPKGVFLILVIIKKGELVLLQVEQDKLKLTQLAFNAFFE